MNKLKLREVGGMLSVNDVVIGNDGKDNVILTDNDDLPAIMLAAFLAGQFWRKNGLPPYVIVLGDDPDYVWPPDADQSSVRPLPFRCPNCKARVKHAQCSGEMPAVLVCLCMEARFRYDVPEPKSGKEWANLRLKSRTSQTIVKAKSARGDN